MTAKFQWLTQGSAKMPALNLPVVEQWICDVAESRDRIVGPVTYIFCDDERILEVNKEFLSHDYYTDIITFDDCRGKLLRGDIFISLDTVDSNAVLNGTDKRQELMRVIIHGILHLCGINDKGPGEREIMEAAENESLAMLDKTLEKSHMPLFTDDLSYKTLDSNSLSHKPESEEAYMDRSIREAGKFLRDTEKNFE